MDDDTRKDDRSRLPIHRPPLGDHRPVRRSNVSPISLAPRGMIAAWPLSRYARVSNQSQSIMPLSLFIPSLHRVQDASPRSPDSLHPLHALLDPLLLSVRSVVTKYHTELPQILAQGGGEGETEESMMWYTLGYEVGEVGEGSTSVNSEDAIMFEERSRNMWLERLERREWVSMSCVDTPF